jgi:regulator of sigma E protease
VDGGLFTFLILEKIQGKPLSPKAQAIAQVVGFALIISVFLLVTYQDIRRTIGM